MSAFTAEGFFFAFHFFSTSLTIPESIIKDVSITSNRPYFTHILDLNATYTLMLTDSEGNRSVQQS